MNKEKHPWQEFLDSRIKAILWMKSKYYTDEMIVEYLSMDLEQLKSIINPMPALLKNDEELPCNFCGTKQK